ncbi:MAG: DUF551 domain-containing protein [Lachnospiraceae bacterium]|nr:DUF551 domain-containing protein [Lachnospiraceae bacterium]
MTKQELKECIAEVRHSDMPKPAKKKVMNVLYDEPHKGWIPCSERMPETGIPVLCQWHKRNELEADDDGFVNNANRIRRVVDASEEDYNILFQNGYLLHMAQGLVVVAHWRICNSIRKDRYKPTVHQSEWKRLKIKDNVYVVDGQEDAAMVPVANIPKEMTVQKFEEFWKAYPKKRA